MCSISYNNIYPCCIHLLVFLFRLVYNFIQFPLLVLVTCSIRLSNMFLMQPLSILELMFTLHELLWCHMVHYCFIYLGVDELQLREDWWRRHSTLSVHATAWTLAAWTAWTELRYHSGQHDRPKSGQVHVWHNIHIWYYAYLYRDLPSAQ